ncbi:hypothetical protein acsn021_29730 [Anaerocolumna cellulosilytica]|uniref:Uncharacterized protein n=1 Tax=Anaerocolumna cellulosilytica TaxID=433286 RepID=A0A6S6QXN0_9FIRM|nr:hypothetical protein [Anaerocolumna cellulosilytica]MBB5197192.1 hypothetical protein [Anaerocolumna cellulosilytica]BCJ95404.1 hypothetical protein acsn021_29730 [Anaerocolumna cellulosilytica]
MKSNTNEHYHYASINTDDLAHITELENSLSSKTNRNIVLIAYEPNDTDSNKTKIH